MSKLEHAGVQAPSYQYPNYTVRNEATSLDCSDSVDMTVQGPKEDCDINVMMKRFGITGQMPVFSGPEPFYGDFSGITDYQSAIEAVREAQEAFGELPAEVRARFENNPADLITWLEDPKNKEEARQLGLLKDPPVPPEPPAPKA